jgi:hypothetical protein
MVAKWVADFSIAVIKKSAFPVGLEADLGIKKCWFGPLLGREALRPTCLKVLSPRKQILN